eukprot:16798-Heterococcus_DN1.PRE.3
MVMLLQQLCSDVTTVLDKTKYALKTKLVSSQEQEQQQHEVDIRYTSTCAENVKHTCALLTSEA